MKGFRPCFGLVALALTLAPVAAASEQSDVRLIGEVDGGLLQAQCGERVNFRFQVVGTNGVRVAVTRYADDGKSGESVTLTPDDEGHCAYSSSTDVPGALMAAAKVVTADGKEFG